MQRSKLFRGAALGAWIGATLAVALHSWYLFATYVLRLAGEGVAFGSYMIAMLLGFPTNILVSLCMDYLRSLGLGLLGLNDYHVLLPGIVVNWALIFWLGRYVRGVRSSTPHSQDR